LLDNGSQNARFRSNEYAYINQCIYTRLVHVSWQRALLEKLKRCAVVDARFVVADETENNMETVGHGDRYSVHMEVSSIQEISLKSETVK
jgi:hypothetical protein